jgi:hypothetical protein
MSKILDLYNANLDTAGVEAKKIPVGKVDSLATPYSEDKGYNADSKVLTDAFLKDGRKGDIPTKKYSDSIGTK